MPKRLLFLCSIIILLRSVFFPLRHSYIKSVYVQIAPSWLDKRGKPDHVVMADPSKTTFVVHYLGREQDPLEIEKGELKGKPQKAKEILYITNTKARQKPYRE